MITQPGCRKEALLKKFVLQAHPILQTYIQKLKIAELIGTYIAQDHRLKLPIEQTLCVLIHNILSSPLPMYEIADWVSALDERCLGLEPSEAGFIHDDRVGQALDSFYQGRHKDVFFHLALRAIKVFEVDCPQIHQDTTTVTCTRSMTVIRPRIVSTPRTIVASANCSSEPTSSMWPIASWPPWKTFAASTAAEAVSSV